MWNHHFGHHYGFYWVWIINILLISGVVYLFYTMNKNEPDNQSKDQSPLEILKKRYAKGEITTQEFEEMKKKLE